MITIAAGRTRDVFEKLPRDGTSVQKSEWLIKVVKYRRCL